MTTSAPISIHTDTVEIHTLRIGRKQVTKSLLQQIEHKELVPGIELLGIPWGRINHHDKTCEGGLHRHILWQEGNELRQAAVYWQELSDGARIYGDTATDCAALEGMIRLGRCMPPAESNYRDGSTYLHNGRIDIYPDMKKLDPARRLHHTADNARTYGSAYDKLAKKTVRDGEPRFDDLLAELTAEATAAYTAALSTDVDTARATVNAELASVRRFLAECDQIWEMLGNLPQIFV